MRRSASPRVTSTQHELPTALRPVESSGSLGSTISSVVNRIFVPLALLGLTLAAFWASDRLGNEAPEDTPRVTLTSSEVPLLSARRLPEFLTVPKATETLTTAADSVMDDSPPLSCLRITDADGRPLYTRGENTPLIPASTLKLVTAAAVLLEFPPDHTFTTQVLATEAPVDGIVGDLYLVGSGDPLLMTAEYARSFRSFGDYTSVDELADAVLAAGVTQVNGGIVAVTTRYDDVRYAEGWPPRFAEQGQSGPLSALMVNDGFTSWPATWLEREDAAQLGVATTSTPGIHAAALFDDLLEAREVIPARGQREEAAVDPAALQVIAEISSPPITSIVEEMLVFSDNTTAELLTKELGLRVNNVGSTVQGTGAILSILDNEGIESFEIAPKDGSGLDATNKITCAQLVDVLEHPQVGPVLQAMLPVAAESGTIYDRFEDTAAAGRMQAKTGSLLNVTALAGFVTNSENEQLHFAYLANTGEEVTVTESLRSEQEPLADALAEYPVGPGVDLVAPPGAVALPASDPGDEDATDEDNGEG